MAMTKSGLMESFRREVRVRQYLASKADPETVDFRPNGALRDATIQSGTEHGAAESYDKLAEILEQAQVVER
jgi:hypothetical protein